MAGGVSKAGAGKRPVSRLPISSTPAASLCFVQTHPGLVMPTGERQFGCTAGDGRTRDSAQSKQGTRFLFLALPPDPPVSPRAPCMSRHVVQQRLVRCNERATECLNDNVGCTYTARNNCRHSSSRGCRRSPRLLASLIKESRVQNARIVLAVSSPLRVQWWLPHVGDGPASPLRRTVIELVPDCFDQVEEPKRARSQARHHPGKLWAGIPEKGWG